jgi:2,3-dihydroxy-p-cumate/2,3-dihydroxybenzoate 3,4-dioxygenase
VKETIMSEIRYKRVAYVALSVTNLERSTAFLKEIVGLQDGGQSSGNERFLRCSSDHHNVVLREGPAPGIHRVAFEMESERALTAVENHLRSIGIQPTDVSDAECRALGQQRSIRFAEPNTGVTVELMLGMETLPTPFSPTVAKIARLGHIVLGAKDQKKTVEFFMKEMNFRKSDEIDGAVAFMRCFPNPFHHSFAVGAAPENRLHHVNFMVTDMDDIGAAMYRLQKNNVPIVFGPGRHSQASGSIFIYFLDPDGMTFEYSFGMEEFPEVDPRPSKVLPAKLSSFDNWGTAAPDPRFASVGRVMDPETT